MNKIEIHWILMRPFAILGLIPPFLLGALMSSCQVGFDLIPSIMAFIGSSMILYASHYHNSYSDYISGVDTVETTYDSKGYTSASSILPRGLISTEEVMIFTVLLYMLGSLSWLVVILSTNMWAFIPYALGILCAVLYNEGGKYKGYGETLISFAFGLSITLAGYVPNAQSIDIGIIAVALIPGILWMLFYTIDQMSDSEFDKKCGIVNLAIKFLEYDFPISRYVEFGYLSVIIFHMYLILNNILPPQSLISIASIPLAFATILCVDKNPKKGGMMALASCGLYVLLLNMGFIL